MTGGETTNAIAPQACCTVHFAALKKLQLLLSIRELWPCCCAARLLMMMLVCACPHAAGSTQRVFRTGDEEYTRASPFPVRYIWSWCTIRA